MNRISLRALAGLLAGTIAIAACGGGGGHSPGAGVVPQAAKPGNFTGATTFVWGSSLLSQLPYAGPAKAAGFALAVMVHMQNGAGLVQYAQSASTPGSPNYRHWLTPAQIGQQYGATAANYQAVAQYFRGYGLNVGTWPQREIVTVSGSTKQFAQAFGTSFGTYTYLGKRIVAPIGTPKFAASLPVDSIVGLVSAVGPHSYLIKNNNAAYLGYSPQQIAQGFDYSGAYAAGFTGSGMHVGIIGTGPILDSQGHDDDTAAVAAYWHANVGTVTQVAVSPQPASSANAQTGTGVSDNNQSGLATPPPLTSPACTQSFPPDYQTCNPEDGEAQLDTETVSALAPGATTLFYLAFDTFECYDPTTDQLDPLTGTDQCPSGDVPGQAEGLPYLSDDEIQQAIADDTADAISMSFGEPENQALGLGYITSSGAPGLGQIEMASMVGEGMAVFVASGDDGAWECFDPATGAPLGTPCVSYPASDPSVVAVGGVNIPLDESGNLTGAITAWADNTTLGGDPSECETIEGQPFCNDVGSGGGVSAVFTPPPWQSATVSDASMREVPDMALDADPKTGPSLFIDIAFGGYATVGASGGTSAAAPEAAAQWALVLQACKASSACSTGSGPYPYRLGNPAPLLYAIYGTSSLAKGSYKPGSFSPHLTYSQVFYDEIYGDNQAVPASATPAPATTPGGYNAGPGYDEVTGLGSPFTGHLIQAITGTAVQ